MVSPLSSIIAQGRSNNPLLEIGQQISQHRGRNAQIEGQNIQNQMQQQQLNQMQAPSKLSPEQSLGAAQYINRLGKQLLSTDESQWSQILTPNLPQLQQLGYTPEMLQGMTREQIQAVVQQTEPLMGAASARKTKVLSEGQQLVDESTGEVVAEGRGKTEDVQPRVEKLRSRYDTFSKDLRQVDAAFRKIKTASNNAQGDMSLIFGFMKLLDPGSTVREGEFQSAEVTEGIPGRIINIRNRLLSGERLNEDQRQAFRDEAESLLSAQRESSDSQVATILQQADEDGVSRASVLGAKNLREFEKRAADRVISQAGKDEGAAVIKTQKHGDVTEDDIQETMRANNMTREEVIARLQGG